MTPLTTIQNMSRAELESAFTQREEQLAQAQAACVDLHRVVGTALVKKDGRFLIVKRSADRKVFPNLWTVPGGGLEQIDYINKPHQYQPNQWYQVFDESIRRELREEVGLEVGRMELLIDLVFLRPDRTPVIVFSFVAPYKTGEVTLNNESVDFAWVTAVEAERFDLIPGILHEIQLAENHQGWLSPDEAKRLEAKAAAMREACMWMETFKGLFEGNRKTLTLMLDKALSTTAGQDLLDRLERYEKAFAMNTPWPITEVLETAQVWLDHLALIHNCDHHGWERAKECRDQISNRLMDALEALKGDAK